MDDFSPFGSHIINFCAPVSTKKTSSYGTAAGVLSNAKPDTGRADELRVVPSSSISSISSLVV